MTITVITNHQFRNMIYGYDLTPKQRAEFNYMTDDELNSHDFFEYRGVIYDPSEFTLPPSELQKDWDGIHTDTFFSGVLIKYSSDMEQVKIGRCYS